MYTHFFYWQFVLVPKWLLTLYWNLQLAVLRFFSVGLMLRTLVSPWRKDIVPILSAGSITGILQAFTFNLISRGVGFFIRTAVLLVWVVSHAGLIILGAILALLFIIWPFVILVVMATGLVLIFSSL